MKTCVCWKMMFSIIFISLTMQVCNGQWTSYLKAQEEEDEKKQEAYQFTETEMSAIQAMLTFRQVISEILDKVTINWPSLASVILRSDNTPINRTPVIRVPHEEMTTTKSSGLGSALLRGVALSLPLLLPMAPILKRMSSGPSVYTGPAIPFIPDPYYNTAMHRRRMGRSTRRASVDDEQLKHLESIFASIEALSRKYQQQPQQQV